MGLIYLRCDLDALKFTCLNRQKTPLREYSSLFSDIHVPIFVSQNRKIDVNVLTLRGFIKLKILNSSVPFRASNSHFFVPEHSPLVPWFSNCYSHKAMF